MSEEGMVWGGQRRGEAWRVVAEVANSALVRPLCYCCPDCISSPFLPSSSFPVIFLSLPCK